MSLASARAASRLLFAFVLLAAVGPDLAPAAMIDFESPGNVDGTPVGDQYLASDAMGFALDLDGDGHADPGALPKLERRGADAGWAFVNDTHHADDEARPGYEAQLGDWMLAAMPIQSAGKALIVSYAEPVRLASGVIWDIDGNPMQGTEQWRIDALAVDGSVLASVLSPLGEHLDDSGLNAKPWEFWFDRDGADIGSLRIEFVGTKTVGLGVAFDQFYCAVPEPGTLVLLASGVALLARARRR